LAEYSTRGHSYCNIMKGGGKSLGRWGGRRGILFITGETGGLHNPFMFAKWRLTEKQQHQSWWMHAYHHHHGPHTQSTLHISFACQWTTAHACRWLNSHPLTHRKTKCYCKAEWAQVNSVSSIMDVLTSAILKRASCGWIHYNANTITQHPAFCSCWIVACSQALMQLRSMPSHSVGLSSVGKYYFIRTWNGRNVLVLNESMYVHMYMYFKAVNTNANTCISSCEETITHSGSR